MTDPGFVDWVDAQLGAFEAQTGAACPLRSIPIDLIAAAVDREAELTNTAPTIALAQVVDRYCQNYLPPRLDQVDRSDIYSPGGMMTATRIERDGS